MSLFHAAFVQMERWQQAGVFDRLLRILLTELNAAGELDWSRACADGSHIRARAEQSSG
ncbi:hypothetical protein [Streptomyces sp. NPDC060065]|uniref:hypothetical protein n=1 Tax=Streptomyces sp. NPDC060065 TaxID=3347050 RepID=UPI00367ED021